MPPRYFTARPSSEPSADRPAHPVTHPLDVFVLESGHRDAEWVVGFDDLGQLSAQPFAEAAAVASVRQRIAFHEVAGGTRRRLRAAELHLFELTLVEQAADSPGFDDPVYLYGTLLGPLGSGGVAVEGQLTVTRADLLEAAARGAGHAFRYADPGGRTGARAFHLLLPGDRPEELAQARGLVLAYPVLSAELQAASPGNEFFFNQILYDVITGVWSDVEREAPPPRRRPQDVPVPNRALIEQRLVNEGFVIEGNSAIRKRRGLLGSVLGALVEDRRPLPPEGGSDDYVRLADEALAAMAGWPTARARALRACLGGWASNQLPGRGSAAPIDPAMALPPPPPPPRHRAGPPEWMSDFITAHQKPGAKPPVVTGAARGSETPSWMSDFAQSPTDDRTAEPAKPQAKPDWMKDFDS